LVLVYNPLGSHAHEIHLSIRSPDYGALFPYFLRISASAYSIAISFPHPAAAHSDPTADHRASAGRFIRQFRRTLDRLETRAGP
jgi:hypothetical protein